jgi:hypothetical protein
MAVVSASSRKMLCQLYEPGATVFDNGLDVGRYLAAVETDILPRVVHRDDRIIQRGYAVGFTTYGTRGQWYFFGALEPAVAFGRAARMSLDGHTYGVYEAAHDLMFCEIHDTDEQVLLVTLGARVDRQPGEVEVLERFVQGIKEHPKSSYWHESLRERPGVP